MKACNLLFLCTVVFTYPVLEATLPVAAGNQWQLLDMVEDGTLGTIITQADIPYTITQAGKYSLIEDISNTSAIAPAIRINVSDVTLNLNGRAITSTQSTAIECVGISDTQILNGTLKTANNTALLLQTCEQMSVTQINVGTYSGIAFSLQACIDIIIKSCSFDHNNGLGAQTTVDINDGCETIALHDCIVKNPLLNDGFSVSSDSNAILFRNCQVLGTSSAIDNTGIGFNILGSRVVCYNCTVTNLDTGFYIPLDDTTTEGCSAESLTHGFILTTGTGTGDGLINNCQSMGCTTGFEIVNCPSGVISNSLATGGTTGFFINNSANAVIENSVATGNTNGFLTADSNYVAFNSCTALQSSTNGFALVTTPTASLKNCTANMCGTGFGGTTTTLGNIVIKDSLFCYNNTGIVGTNLYILDTRSGLPFNNLADALVTSTVITY